ncbi:MAG TPA: phospholipid carrier-dependent glycosyltransferase [Candidatus Stackebrandtia excrementipullorum]|nr:phospholipid carrier-dependent glycosyltransferase [Candidatus Stackebrandtia excrementipullorum]
MNAAAVDHSASRLRSDRTDPVVTEELRARLTGDRPTDRLRCWITVATVTTFAAVLRLIGLTHPKGLIFDEIYYAQDAHQLLDHGVEWNVDSDTGSYVAHPPFGKWCIALGEWLFGYNEFGWRIGSVVAGVASVVLVILLARKLTGSTMLGGAAGLLMSMDGLHFVLSRTALLDIFLMVFVLAAFYCIVLDREHQRRRWLKAVENGIDPTAGDRPHFTIPWWRVAAGVLSGLAMGVKWSALWFILLLIVVTYVWEYQLRRTLRTPRPLRDTLLDETGWVTAFGLLSVGTYLATWTGWFASDDGSFRHWRADQGMEEPPVLGALHNLWEYHVDVLEFHENLSSEHTYQSWPWQWLLNVRPVVFFWSSDVDCGTERCASEVLLLGTPLLWWAFIPALIAVLWWAVVKRDWRAWAILAGVFAGIAPWLLYPDRTMFFFYAIPAQPFLVMAVVFAMGMAIGPRTASPERRLTGALACAGFMVLVALCFAYFWPLYTGQVMPYDDWHARIWLGSNWI